MVTVVNPNKAHSAQIIITDELGLHARPSAKIVRVVQRYSSKVILSYGTHTADASSILSILSLAAAKGAVVTVTSSGENAEAVLNDIVALFSVSLDTSK